MSNRLVRLSRLDRKYFKVKWVDPRFSGKTSINIRSVNFIKVRLVTRQGVCWRFSVDSTFILGSVDKKRVSPLNPGIFRTVKEKIERTFHASRNAARSVASDVSRPRGFNFRLKKPYCASSRIHHSASKSQWLHLNAYHGVTVDWTICP